MYKKTKESISSLEGFVSTQNSDVKIHNMIYKATEIPLKGLNGLFTEIKQKTDD